MIQSTDSRQQNRLLAIGDIHGCLEQLKALMKQVMPTSSDKIVFLGDYVDRGPASAGVIDYLIEFGAAFPATVFLRGNHEQMFAEYLEGHDPTAFLMNGGLRTLSSYVDSGQWPIPSSHHSFLETLINYYETEDYIFVHAGLRPDIPLLDQDNNDLIWIRREFISSTYDWGKSVVYGHTPLKEPFLAKSRLGLDTGCVYGRQLTCCDVQTRDIWQIDCASTSRFFLHPR
jgi:serine/threonine protein phosphatase 1